MAKSMFACFGWLTSFQSPKFLCTTELSIFSWVAVLCGRLVCAVLYALANDHTAQQLRRAPGHRAGCKYSKAV